jgi:hypothetical protein
MASDICSLGSSIGLTLSSCSLGDAKYFLLSYRGDVLDDEIEVVCEEDDELDVGVDADFCIRSSSK